MLRIKLCFIFALLGLIASLPTETLVEEVDIDVAELFTELFVPATREARELDDGVDEAFEARELEAEDVAEITEEEVADSTEEDVSSQAQNFLEVARFNNYMDAIYKRMNGALKAKMMDPMELNLNQKLQKKSEKKEGEADKNPRKMRGKRDVDVDEDDYAADIEAKEEDDELVDMVDRMGKPHQKKGNKKSGVAKKSKGEKKDGKNKKAMREAAKKDKQVQKKKKQEAREKKRQEKKNKKEQKEQKNKGRSAKGEKQQKAVKNKRKNNEESKNKNNHNAKNNHKNGKKSNKRARNNNNEKMLGSLSGIATLKREGDVVVVDKGESKEIYSHFTVGPLKLEVSKINSKGKDRSMKTAIAKTDVMSGKMVLKVKPDGSAFVKKVVFKEPKDVEVKGSLANTKERNVRTLRSSVNRMRPLAALRLLQTARFVLKAPSTNN